MRWLRKFRALPPHKRRLLLQALWLLGAMRFALLARPFKRLVVGMQQHAGVVALAALDDPSRATAECIGWAVQTAAGRTPWQSTCLVQVLAAQRMLHMRGIAGALYLGAMRESGENDEPSLSAHAWLKCGNEFITGERGHERFTVVSVFSWA
jgi:hypothetical protein